MELLSQNAEAQRPKSLTGVLAALGLILAFLYVGRLFFVTLVSSVILAFILEPVVMFFMRFRLPRGAASFLACTAALLVLYLAALGVYMQAVGLWADIPSYTQKLADLVDAATTQLESVEKTAKGLLIPRRIRDQEQAAAAQKASPPSRKKRVAEPPLPPPIQEVRIQQERESLVNQVWVWLYQFSGALLMASFVPFLVYFMLSWRDHIRRSWLNLFAGERREMATVAWEEVARVARAYVVGNFLLGILLAVVSSLFFWLANLPYWQLVGPISGFLSLVPYIGLPLALIPPLFAALPVYSSLTGYLVIATVVGVLHLLALNLLYPKLVGGRVHLNPLVVTVALMFWYILWDGAGLLLAIPITAGMKSVFENIPSLRAYGRLMGD